MISNESRFVRGIRLGAALLGVTAIFGCSADVSPEPAGMTESQGLLGFSEAPKEQSPPTWTARTRFYAPPPEPAAAAQIDELFEHHHRRAAFDLVHRRPSGINGCARRFHGAWVRLSRSD